MFFVGYGTKVTETIMFNLQQTVYGYYVLRSDEKLTLKTVIGTYAATPQKENRPERMNSWLMNGCLTCESV